MGDLQFYDIIIFAGIAAFLIYRMRKVLGKRTGFVKQNNDIIKPAEQEIKKDKATCERAKKSEITLRSTPLVKQGGKILTIEEKNQQLANVKEIIKIHCK